MTKVSHRAVSAAPSVHTRKLGSCESISAAVAELTTLAPIREKRGPCGPNENRREDARADSPYGSNSDSDENDS